MYLVRVIGTSISPLPMQMQKFGYLCQCSTDCITFQSVTDLADLPPCWTRENTALLDTGHSSRPWPRSVETMSTGIQHTPGGSQLTLNQGGSLVAMMSNLIQESKYYLPDKILM